MSSEGTPQDTPSEIGAVSEANNYLAINLYKLLANADDNVFFSPFSLSTALAMLFCGTGSENSVELRSVLGYEVASIKDEKLKDCFKILLEDLAKNAKSYTLACANSIVVDKNFCVKDDYKSILQNSFKALLKIVDFQRESEKAVAQINAWVKDETKGMIPKLLDSLGPTTVMLLLNAVYFKGSWLSQFKEKNTRSKSFYNQGLDKGKKDVKMMHQTELFPFAERESFKALELPYQGKDIAMLILLPHSKNGLAELDSQLTHSFIQEVKSQMSRRKVDVELPKFNMEYSKSMKECFEQLGVKLAFRPGADFGPITNRKDIYVSAILHKAVLKVNEEGSEAAAVTAVIMKGRSVRRPPPTPTFIVDHPFSFVIYSTKSNLILFMGRVNKL